MIVSGRGRTVLLAVTMALTAFGMHARAAGTIAADPAEQPKIFWQMVMEQYFGPYDRTLKCWISKAAGERFCMRPHRLDTVSVKGKDQQFVAVGGTRIGPEGELQQAHVDAGVLGLLIFEQHGDRQRLIARNDLHTNFGSFGTVPSEDQFAVRQIGPDETYGWVAVDGWMGQGIMITSANVFTAIGDTITQIATLPAHYDNSGNCENGKAYGTGLPCSNYSFELMFDPSDSSGRYYPAVLRLGGTREGESLDQVFTTTFDPAKLRYRPIANLPKEFAEGI